MITTTGNRSASSCLNASWSSLRLATHHQVEPPGQTELVILAEVILCSLSYLLLGRQEGLSLPQSSDISRACSCVVAQSTDCWTGLVNNRLRVDDFRPGAAAQCSWASWTVYNICWCAVKKLLSHSLGHTWGFLKYHFTTPTVHKVHCWTTSWTRYTQIKQLWLHVCHFFLMWINVIGSLGSAKCLASSASIVTVQLLMQYSNTVIYVFFSNICIFLVKFSGTVQENLMTLC